jgi:hypothetical protein
VYHVVLVCVKQARTSSVCSSVVFVIITEEVKEDNERMYRDSFHYCVDGITNERVCICKTCYKTS